MLTFSPVLPEPWFLDDHTRRGGRRLRLFVAEHAGGFLRCILAEEPTVLNPPSAYELHLSVSLAISPDRHTPPARAISLDEAMLAISHFFRLGTKFEELKTDSLVRHFWAPLGADGHLMGGG